MSTPVDVNEAQFDQEVLESDIPVLVDFWAPWCGPCRQVAPLLEAAAATYASRLKIVKVNVDENPDLAQTYNVQSIPNLVMITGGEPRQGLVGAPPREALQKFIEQFI